MSNQNNNEVNQAAILQEIFLSPSNTFRSENEAEAAQCSGKCSTGVCRSAGL